MVVLNKKMEDASARAASETAKDAFLLVDSKRRGLFRMERTKAHVIAAGFFEREIIRNDLHDRSAVANSGDRLVRNHAPRLAIAALRSPAGDSAQSKNLLLPKATSCCARCWKAGTR